MVNFLYFYILNIIIKLNIMFVFYSHFLDAFVFIYTHDATNLSSDQLFFPHCKRNKNILNVIFVYFLP